MATTRKRRAGRPTTGKPRAKRASVSLPPEVYTTIEALATQKKVSVSWIVRDAIEKYLTDQWPLLGGSKTTALELSPGERHADRGR